MLAPGSTIGIIGGGQLARMLGMAAHRLGYRTHILADAADSPASQVTSMNTVAAYDDTAAVVAWAKTLPVVSFEWENIPPGTLSALEATVDLRPGRRVLATSQDRMLEKSWINSLGLPTARWLPAHTSTELAEAAMAIGYPCVAKTTRLGYDGHGQRVMHGPDDADAAWRALHPKPLIVEGFVDLRRELSIIIARGADGSTRTFDISTNHHVDHILDTTMVPSDLGDAATLHIIDMAETMARDIGLVGIMAIELFEDRDGRILVNEIAPRPHNSGHWTMDACAHGQFDLQIRAVAGMPLPDTRRHSDAVMRNLLGQEGMDEWCKLVAEPWVIAHWYGKAAARPGRKMGHVTTLFPRDSLRCMGC